MSKLDALDSFAPQPALAPQSATGVASGLRAIDILAPRELTTITHDLKYGEIKAFPAKARPWAPGDWELMDTPFDCLFSRSLKSPDELSAWIEFILRTEFCIYPEHCYLPGGRRILANTWSLMRSMVKRRIVGWAPNAPDELADPQAALTGAQVREHLENAKGWCRMAQGEFEQTSKRRPPDDWYFVWLTYKEAARELGFQGVAMISRLVKNGRLRAEGCGKSLRIDPESVRRVCRAREYSFNRAIEKDSEIRAKFRSKVQAQGHQKHPRFR